MAAAVAKEKQRVEEEILSAVMSVVSIVIAGVAGN
jgi:hypothetical protein